jgi:hypothetical protein
MEKIGSVSNWLNVKNYHELDDGKIGKCWELAVREYVQPRSGRTGKVSHNYTWYADMKKRATDGSYWKFEIKSACGELDNIDKADFIIYCPEVDLNILPEKQGFVIPVNDFLQLMEGVGYSGKGQVTRLKSTRTGKIVKSFQSFFSNGRPKASKKLADYIWDFCYNYPVVEEFFQ